MTRGLTLTIFLINKVFYISVILVSLILPGCLQVPDQHRIVSSSETNQTAVNSDSACITHVTPAVREELALDATGFRVLSWNLYKGFEEGWQADLQSMAGESDLLLLQEGYLKDDLLTFLGSHDLHWNLATAFNYQGIPSGVLTASKVTPEKTCSLRTLEPLILLPKTVMITHYPLSDENGSLLVANIHGINYTLGLEAFKNQLEQVHSLLKAHNGPLVFAGDFNTWSRRRQELVTRMADDLGLTSIEFIEDNRTSLFGFPLDNIFYRGLVAEHAKTAVVDSSDHNPILVTFKVFAASSPNKNTANTQSVTLFH